MGKKIKKFCALVKFYGINCQMELHPGERL